jgi:hypothetical protein
MSTGATTVQVCLAALRGPNKSLLRVGRRKPGLDNPEKKRGENYDRRQ